MKKLAALSVAVVLVLTASSASRAEVHHPDPRTMRLYVVGILVKGPMWTAERTPHTDSIQAGHMANIHAMVDMGVLLGAGPFEGNERERGLFLFKDIPLDSAATLCRRDPAIRAERLMVELYRWLAPAGIGEAYRARALVRPDHPDSMIRMPMAFLEHPSMEPKLDSLVLAQSAAAHVGMMIEQLENGTLLAAGPVVGDQKLLGLSFFGTDSATALKLVHEDPTVQNGRMTATMRQWWTAWGVLPPVPTVKEMGK